MSKYRLMNALRAAKETAAANVETRAAMLQRYPNAAESFLDQWPVDWQTVARKTARRRYAKPSLWNPIYKDDSGDSWRWLERVEGSGLSVAFENATRVNNGTGTTGYYVDAMREESQSGAVLVTRDIESPRALFFAAIEDIHNEGAYRVLWQPFNDAREALRVAEREAAHDAASQMEYDAAWQAGREWADKGEEVKGYRAAALAILRDRKGAKGSATLCAVIREKIESLRESIREAREAREELADGNSDLFGFYSGDDRLRAAFNDGAGVTVLSV